MTGERAMVPPAAPATFGGMLKYLRRRARLTQRELAIAVGYSEAQISRLEQNQRLPDLATLAALFVPVFDLDDEPEMAAQFLELAAAARGESLGDHSVRQTTRTPTRTNVSGLLEAALPVLPTPLIGRDADVVALCALVRSAATRLLTITGVGGVGKTRLGVAAAQALRDDFADGVWFVPLAPLADPALVLSAIAHALELSEQADQPIVALLGAALRDKQLLIVLDNCEHLLAVAPQLADLLEACPQLTLLATSRAPFALPVEQCYPVVPLALPDLACLSDPAALAATPAVALFVARARAVVPHFVLTTENAASVALVCVRLDGLPLAIELVVVHLTHMSVAALVAQLDQRLAVLTDGSAALPARQRTLRATIDWSYGLLSTPAQALVRRLGVFRGGAHHEAIVAVCCFDAVAESALDTLLTLLLTHNVLGQTITDEVPRYMLLETMQEYAREQMQQHGESTTLHQRHAAYVLACAEAAAQPVHESQQPTLLARLTLEQDNVRLALDTLRAAPSALPLLRLCVALIQFWDMRGMLREGRQTLEAALARSKVTGSDESAVQLDRARAQALEALSKIAWLQGSYVYAHTVAEQALHMYRAQADAAGIANMLHRLGAIAGYQGDYERAQHLYEQSLFHRPPDDQLGAAYTRINLGVTAYERGELAAATVLYHQALELVRTCENQRGIAIVLNNLGDIACRQEQQSRAAACYAESLMLYDALGDHTGIVFLLESLAALATPGVQFEQAVRLLGAANALREILMMPLPPANQAAYWQTVTHARAQMDPARFATCWVAGGALALDDAVQEALAHSRALALHDAAQPDSRGGCPA